MLRTLPSFSSTCSPPRLLPPAGPDLLGLRVPDGAGDRAGLRVPEPAAGADPGRPGRRARLGVSSRGASRHTTTASTDERARRPPAAPTRPRRAPVDRVQAEADERLKTGKTPLVIEPTGDPSRGPIATTRPVPRPRAARQTIDDILQEAAGRTNPSPTQDVHVTEPGSRYIDFLIPGLIGLNAMGGGLWGIGFLLVNFRIGKLLKRFVATPMPRRDFLLAPSWPPG